MTASLSGHIVQTEGLDTTERGQLTCCKFLRGIVNIAKYDGNIHGMFVAGVVTNREGFS